METKYQVGDIILNKVNQDFFLIENIQEKYDVYFGRQVLFYCYRDLDNGLTGESLTADVDSSDEVEKVA